MSNQSTLWLVRIFGTIVNTCSVGTQGCCLISTASMKRPRSTKYNIAILWYLENHEFFLFYITSYNNRIYPFCGFTWQDSFCWFSMGHYSLLTTLSIIRPRNFCSKSMISRTILLSYRILKAIKSFVLYIQINSYNKRIVLFVDFTDKLMICFFRPPPAENLRWPN